MPSTVLDQLQTYGPERCERLTVPEARAWTRRLVRNRYENFSVLSSLVPRDLRDDFAAVYAFCRWADDFGDEVGDPRRSLELLDWWRQELRACVEGEPRHPVFVALQPTIVRHDLPTEPFEDLIAAFEQDQTVTRYDSWPQLIDYCVRSANPVGRLVLMMCGEPRTEAVFGPSDHICTALQLTNHWQDIRRDVLERDRIYIPRELIEIDRFETRLVESARQGWAVDHTFLEESRLLVRQCCERTWPLYESGESLYTQIGPASRGLVWLLAAGGQHVLRLIQMWNYETTLHRPKLNGLTRIMLVAAARWRARTRGDRPRTGGAAA